jgi:hypothetical protein
MMLDLQLHWDLVLAVATVLMSAVLPEVRDIPASGSACAR